MLNNIRYLIQLSYREIGVCTQGALAWVKLDIPGQEHLQAVVQEVGINGVLHMQPP